MVYYDACAETDARYGCDNYCPIYEGERLTCEECGECYEECEECYMSPIQRFLGQRLAMLQSRKGVKHDNSI